MKRPSPASRVAREVKGNVIWLAYPARNRRPPASDLISSLKESIAHLACEIERSGALRTDIGAAVSARRYEVYKSSTTSGARAAERGLAAAQQIHLNSLLKFLHATAAAKPRDRAPTTMQDARVDPLAGSIRELHASTQRARELSRDVLTQSRCRDWIGIGSVPHHS